MSRRPGLRGDCLFSESLEIDLAKKKPCRKDLGCDFQRRRHTRTWAERGGKRVNEGRRQPKSRLDGLKKSLGKKTREGENQKGLLGGADVCHWLADVKSRQKTSTLRKRGNRACKSLRRLSGFRTKRRPSEPASQNQ